MVLNEEMERSVLRSQCNRKRYFLSAVDDGMVVAATDEQWMSEFG